MNEYGEVFYLLKKRSFVGKEHQPPAELKRTNFIHMLKMSLGL